MEAVAPVEPKVDSKIIMKILTLFLKNSHKNSAFVYKTHMKILDLFPKSNCIFGSAPLK